MNLSKIILFVILPLFIHAQQRPKIGLALSGGGAKGLAHVGLLKAIDSAGINIEYVAGTSMGSIVGGLYAAGYSGNEIEQFASKMDWNRILSNKASYEELYIHQKQNTDQFVEIPWVNGNPFLGSGVLESNELWLLLSDYFFPYIAETDFSTLPRPFRCVATRLDNGGVVILNQGNLVKSIRASMAIPSVFTPVQIGDDYLIDGGIVRNFPVSEVKDMGADFIIGSSVAAGLLSSEDLNNPLQVINQIAFYGEQRDYKEQVAASDIFVDYPIEKFNAGSFSSAQEIIKMGIQKGEEIFPRLKKLKDSLDLIYGVEEFKNLTVQKQECITVNKFYVKGLSGIEKAFYLNQMNFYDGVSYSPDEIAEQIRTAFATGLFKKINFDLVNNEDGSVNVLLDFVQDHRSFVKAGIGYNTETGLGIKLGVTRYGMLGAFSNSSLAISAGENPQLAARTHHFFDKRRSFYLDAGITGQIIDIGTYNQNLVRTGIIQQNHFNFELNLNRLLTKDLLIGVGSRHELLSYNPQIKTTPEIKGNIRFLNTFISLKMNTLDVSFNPSRGNLINFEGGLVHKQKTKFDFSRLSDEGILHADDYKLKNYASLKYYSAHYFPLKKHTGFIKLNSGIHFGNAIPLMNDFLVGSNNFVARNQILFSGFRLNAISSSSVFTGQMGYRLNFTSKLSLSAAGSVLLHDFVSENYKSNSSGSVLGLDLTAGYRSFMGPIEVSLMYNSINNRLVSTFNVGYSLNFSK